MGEHNISTLQQQKWLVKLVPFDFNITYKASKENIVADALSRPYAKESQDSDMLHSLSIVFRNWITTVTDEVKENSWLQEQIQKDHEGLLSND